MIYNAGMLNKRIKIVGTGTVQDKDGFDTVGEKVIATCWAAILPARGREYYDSQKLRNDETIKIIIRYRSDMQDSYKIKYQEHTYNIQSIVNPAMQNESLELYCIEQKRGNDTKPKTDNAGGWET